jgi:phospholipid transport system substrate-binding protein
MKKKGFFPMLKFRITALILGMLLMLLPCSSIAGVPMETIEVKVNELLNVLGDKSLEGEAGKEAKEEAIRKISNEMFDFIEVGKRALGRNWRKFSRDQRKEFVTLFRKLLENVYMDRLLEYTNEKIVFEKEIMLSENKVEVFSNIVASDKSIPINYRLILKNDKWKVYDVIIEGISMIKNYRTQFNEILSKKSPDQMIEDLRVKITEQKS